MQSIFGALLTAGYVKAATAAIGSSPNAADATTAVQNELTKSFSSAANVAEQYPQYSKQIEAAAQLAFVDGDEWAYAAGIIAVLLGAALVFFKFPKMQREQALLAEYHEEDTAATPVAA